MRGLSKTIIELKKRTDYNAQRTDAIENTFKETMTIMQKGFVTALENNTKMMQQGLSLVLENNRLMMQQMLGNHRLLEGSPNQVPQITHQPSKKRKALQADQCNVPKTLSKKNKGMVVVDKRLSGKQSVIVLMTIFIFGLSTRTVTIQPIKCEPDGPAKKKTKAKAKSGGASASSSSAVSDYVVETYVDKNGKKVVKVPLTVKISARLLFMLSAKFCTGAKNIWGIEVRNVLCVHSCLIYG